MLHEIEIEMANYADGWEITCDYSHTIKDLFDILCDSGLRKVFPDINPLHSHYIGIYDWRRPKDAVEMAFIRIEEDRWGCYEYDLYALIDEEWTQVGLRVAIDEPELSALEEVLGKRKDPVLEDEDGQYPGFNFWVKTRQGEPVDLMIDSLSFIEGKEDQKGVIYLESSLGASAKIPVDLSKLEWSYD